MNILPLLVGVDFFRKKLCLLLLFLISVGNLLQRSHLLRLPAGDQRQQGGRRDQRRRREALREQVPGDQQLLRRWRYDIEKLAS